MISVCMATYNGEKNIKEQLDSILIQLSANDEVIISDDNSSDKTLSILDGYNDERIKIFKNKGKGVIENFENALINASGDFIFLSDQDDIWHENKVQFCLKDFKNGYDLVVSDCILFKSDSSEIIMNSYFEFIGARKGFVRNIFKNSYMGCCMAFSREVKNIVIPFPKNLPMHDSWIGIMSEIYFNVKFNNAKLVKYRRHTENASDTGAVRGSAPLLKKIKGRFFLSYNLISYFFKRKIKFLKL